MNRTFVISICVFGLAVLALWAASAAYITLKNETETLLLVGTGLLALSAAAKQQFRRRTQR
jgi:hypothetical protein